MHLQTPHTAPAGPFYVDRDRSRPCSSIGDARSEAGRRQFLGEHRSLPIVDGRGEPVDLKRF